MALVEISRYVSEVQALRAEVETYTRLVRGELALLRGQVHDCMSVNREIARRQLLSEAPADRS